MNSQTLPKVAARLAALGLLVLGGCATDGGPAASSSPGASGGSQSAEDYPMWARVAGLLMLPFTNGASGSMHF